MPETKQCEILSTIGLVLERNNISYDENQFSKYISSEYLNSERRQTDEDYRMFEITLLHHDSGLRVVYTTTESYFGDRVEYRVIDMFINTPTHKRLEVADVDFRKKVFLASGEIIQFGEVDKRTLQ